jgi:hypothetical protein
MSIGSNTLDEPAAQLRRLLGRREDGSRPGVPLVGSGLNLQAARLEGETEDDWSGLLERIAAEMGVRRSALDALPGWNLARWESMLRLWARKKKVEPFQAETDLQKLTCHHLRSQEAKASRWQLYSEFAAAGFQDLISLNFDRRIALSQPGATFMAALKPPEGPQGEVMYRHDRIPQGEGGNTRVWYPHGDTKKFSTLKLGVRRYGFYVVLLAESHLRLGDQWRFKRAWHQWGEDQTVFDYGASWIDAFLERDVVFIGCGLSLDEWPLWSMIRRRAVGSHAAPGTARPGLFYVRAGPPRPQDVPVHVLQRHQIQVLAFSSFDDMWTAIRVAIG